MCHGHPHYHPCSHTSVKWLYCPEAMFDLDTGYETPCSNPIYSTPQPTNVDCPLQSCNFKALTGRWDCCLCGKGPNTQGWCTALTYRMDWNPLTNRVENTEVPCGHGCCSSCSPSSTPGPNTQISFVDIQKGKGNRKVHSAARSGGHRRGGAHELDQSNGGCPPVVEEDEISLPSAATTGMATATATTTLVPGARNSHRSGHEAGAEYPKKPKPHNNKKKWHKGRGHHE
ncbi:hypothetical protein GGS23DRAFT_416148 [Durotheca rogersii]|uniref:uncharacterized protein n=1 Tax=Durotheca rogersii TaxID=419775 RepID=UPI00221FB94C|nr:uncharacterized protein GGS23DRAFT_416148 [Durotheca rogersii]KAI5865230.1 hypothetical protein GGS23DRAFT_416148 [Durotheca rogersii]